MLIKLHSQATTTPKIRATIQASKEPAWVVAERHGTTEQTVWKWRKRDGVEVAAIPRKALLARTPHARLGTRNTEIERLLAVDADQISAIRCSHWRDGGPRSRSRGGVGS